MLCWVSGWHHVEICRISVANDFLAQGTHHDQMKQYGIEAVPEVWFWCDGVSWCSILSALSAREWKMCLDFAQPHGIRWGDVKVKSVEQFDVPRHTARIDFNDKAWARSICHLALLFLWYPNEIMVLWVNAQRPRLLSRWSQPKMWGDGKIIAFFLGGLDDQK